VEVFIVSGTGRPVRYEADVGGYLTDCTGHRRVSARSVSPCTSLTKGLFTHIPT